jgi:hypothetical protein
MRAWPMRRNLGNAEPRTTNVEVIAGTDGGGPDGLHFGVGRSTFRVRRSPRRTAKLGAFGAWHPPLALEREPKTQSLSPVEGTPSSVEGRHREPGVAIRPGPDADGRSRLQRTVALQADAVPNRVTDRVPGTAVRRVPALGGAPAGDARRSQTSPCQARRATWSRRGQARRRQRRGVGRGVRGPL